MPVKSLSSARPSPPPDVRADVVRLLTDMVIAKMTRDFQAKSAATVVSPAGRIRPCSTAPDDADLGAGSTSTTPESPPVFASDSQGASCQA